MDYIFKENQGVMCKATVNDISFLSPHKNWLLSPCKISVRLYLLFRKLYDLLLPDWI